MIKEYRQLLAAAVDIIAEEWGYITELKSGAPLSESSVSDFLERARAALAAEPPDGSDETMSWIGQAVARAIDEQMPEAVEPISLSNCERRPEEHRVSSWHITDEIHDDAGGAGVEWQCPDCSAELVWASGMWWDLQCNCENKHWNFKVNITYVDSQPITT